MKLLQRTTPVGATARPSVVARDRSDARRQEDDRTQWEDYHAFLAAKLLLLEQRIADDQVTFEAVDTRATERAQAVLDKLTPTSRELFSAVLDERRRVVQAALEAQTRGQRQPDPDAVDRQALTELHDEAEGLVESDDAPAGYGYFPRGVAGDVRWYALDVAELVAAPTAASYQVGASDDDTRARLMRVGFAAAFGVLFIVLWLLWPRGTRTQTVVQSLVATDNLPNSVPLVLDIQPVTRAVLVLQTDALTQTMIIHPTETAWPTVHDATDAYWLTTVVAPVRLCLDRTMLDQLTTITLTGGGGWPDRVYTLRETAAGGDIRLDACAGSVASRYGTLQRTAAVPAAAVGDTLTLPPPSAEPLRVTTITVEGPGQDPTLPAQQARVTVAVQTRLDLDWPSYAPTLVLPSGLTYLPAETIAADSGATLRYLVPFPLTSFAIAWDVTDPATHTVLRWRSTLTPPPSRAEVLRTALDVSHLQVRATDDTWTVQMMLINRGTAPLSLVATDLVITQRDRPIAAPNVGALTTPIQPGEQRTITFALPSGTDMVLTVGPFGYRIQ